MAVRKLLSISPLIWRDHVVGSDYHGVKIECRDDAIFPQRSCFVLYFGYDLVWLESIAPVRPIEWIAFNQTEDLAISLEMEGAGEIWVLA